MIRGFFIFMVFICKPKIWTLAANRHPKLWRFFGFFKFSTCCDYHGNEGAEENSRISVKFEPRKGSNNIRLVPLQTQSEGGNRGWAQGRDVLALPALARGAPWREPDCQRVRHAFRAVRSRAAEGCRR